MNELIEEKKEYLRRLHGYKPDDPYLQKEAEHMAAQDDIGFEVPEQDRIRGSKLRTEPRR